MNHDLPRRCVPWATRVLAGMFMAGLMGFVSAGVAANPAQEQACAGQVADMHDIPMSEIRVAHTKQMDSGTAQILVTFHGGNARCTVQADDTVSEIRWNVHDSGGGSASTPKPDTAGQEQACAGRMAEEVNEPMSAVRVIKTTPLKHGHAKIEMESPGMRAACTVDAEFNVVGFKFLPYN